MAGGQRCGKGVGRDAESDRREGGSVCDCGVSGANRHDLPLLPDYLHQSTDASEPIPASARRGGSTSSAVLARGYSGYLPSDMDAHSHGDAHGHSTADGNANYHSHTNGHSNSDVHAHSDPYARASTDSYANPYADAKSDALALCPARLHVYASE